MSQSPLLHIPTKRTDEVDLTGAFRNYIATVYQDDPDKYALEIATLYRLRQDTRGAGKDVTGRDILYRYYGQLELLDLRFPVDEKNVKVLFTWYDAFSQKATSQYSIAYEKACVIFNIAATCSSIGALQNRFEATGLKVAFNYFQAAAGLFLYINENFLHAPSLDLSRDSIKTLHDLMLGQAQECFLEKVLLEKKQGALVAKLAAQAAHVYQQVADGFVNEAIRAQIDRAWIELTKVKVKYFQALSLYHKSMQSETDGKYGESVAYLTSAEAIAKDATKMGTAFAGSFPSFTVSAIAAPSTSGSKGHTTAAAQALLEATKTNLNLITERKTVAIRDNDMIYHDAVPKVETLPSVEKLNAVKPTSFADICANGQADIQKIIGADIFQKLVPLAVHESASLYSEEKAKLLRAEQERVDSANGEFQATLESMNLVPTLEKLKRLSKSSTHRTDGMAVPDEIFRFASDVQASDTAGKRAEELLELLDGFKRKVREVLDEMGFSLDKEQHECEAMRAKFNELWSQEPSGQLTSRMREEIRQHRDSFEKAMGTDGVLQGNLEESKSIIDILRRPRDGIEASFAERLSTSGSAKRGSQIANLIDGTDDGSAGLGILNEQIMIEKMDGLLSRLRSLKKERSDLVEELKTKLHQDDISSLLLLNKNKEAHVFQAELSKFKPLQGRLSANLQAHSQFLRDLANDFNKLQTSSDTIRSIEVTEKKKMALVKEWEHSYQLWKEAKDGLNRGIQFYSSLGDLVESLRSSVNDFVNRREQERAQLAKTLEESEAERRQNSLREQLQRLSVAPAANSPGTSGSPSLQSPRPQQSSAALVNESVQPPRASPAQPFLPFDAPAPQQVLSHPASSPYTFPSTQTYDAGRPRTYAPQLPSSPPSSVGRPEVQPFAPPPPSPQAAQPQHYPFPTGPLSPMPPHAPHHAPQGGSHPPAPAPGAYHPQTYAGPPVQNAAYGAGASSPSPTASHHSDGFPHQQASSGAYLYQQPPPQQQQHAPQGLRSNPQVPQLQQQPTNFPAHQIPSYGGDSSYARPQYGNTSGYAPAPGYTAGSPSVGASSPHGPSTSGYSAGPSFPPPRSSIDMQRPGAQSPQPYGGPPLPPKPFARNPSVDHGRIPQGQPSYGAPANPQGHPSYGAPPAPQGQSYQPTPGQAYQSAANPQSVHHPAPPGRQQGPPVHGEYRQSAAASQYQSGPGPQGPTPAPRPQAYQPFGGPIPAPQQQQGYGQHPQQGPGGYPPQQPARPQGNTYAPAPYAQQQPQAQGGPGAQYGPPKPQQYPPQHPQGQPQQQYQPPQHQQQQQYPPQQQQQAPGQHYGGPLPSQQQLYGQLPQQPQSQQPQYAAQPQGGYGPPQGQFAGNPPPPAQYAQPGPGQALQPGGPQSYYNPQQQQQQQQPQLQQHSNQNWNRGTSSGSLLD
ncbi:BRO1-like domain-containing protein [Powellomyces hirtus]|nr:BRO1-like domain-containing protein [Powellomyces hirtus]